MRANFTGCVHSWLSQGSTVLAGEFCPVPGACELAVGWLDDTVMSSWPHSFLVQIDVRFISGRTSGQDPRAMQLGP